MAGGARRRAGLILLLAASIYLCLAFGQFWTAWSHNPSRFLQVSGAGDVGQSVFFVAQLPYALIHGINPLANNWTNWPYGANYVTNTAVPLLALLVAPITVLTNPILSLNLLFTRAVPTAL